MVKRNRTEDTNNHLQNTTNKLKIGQNRSYINSECTRVLFVYKVICMNLASNTVCYNINICLFVCLMLFNATFNNISVISWRSVLLVEETRVPGENHWPVAIYWQTLSHKVVHLALIVIETHNISGDRH